MTTFLVGVDSSEHSLAALRWAAREAQLHGAELTAVLVWDLFDQRHADGSTRFDPTYGEADADAALAAAVVDALGTEAAASVHRRAVCDLPARGLLEAARAADLLVVGARGRGGFGGLLLGSVSQQCLHHASGPVAVVRAIEDHDAAASGPDAGEERIVVGIDGSDSSRAALAWAVDEARRRGAVVETVYAWEVPMAYGPTGIAVPNDPDSIATAAHVELDRVVSEVLGESSLADAAEVTVQRTVTLGGAATSVLDAAKGADLVVVGRRGAGGFQRLLLGSVSDNVARHAPCPVVVLPARAPGDSGTDPAASA